jgi:hypothetical protein
MTPPPWRLMVRPSSDGPTTLGDVRNLGMRSLTVCCHRCHHETILDPGGWPDDTIVSSFGPRMSCIKCEPGEMILSGRRGSSVLLRGFTRHRVTCVRPAYAASTRHRVTRENSRLRDWFCGRSVNCVDNYRKVARVNHDAAPKNEDRDRCSPKEEFLALARKSDPITLRRKALAQRTDQLSVRSDLSIFPADPPDRRRSSYDRGSGDGPDRRSVPRSLGPGHDQC